MLLAFKHPFIYAIPSDDAERYHLGTMSWAIPSRIGKSLGFKIYWTRLTAIRQLLGDERIQIHDSMREIAEWKLVDTRLSNVDAVSSLKRIEAHFTERFKPRSYQAQGIAWLAKMGRAIVADQTGTGKTIISSGAVVIRSIFDPSVVKGTCLIVTPASVKFQWQDELMAMFRNSSDGDILFGSEDILVYHGQPSMRKMLLKKEPPFWTIINYDLLRLDWDRFSAWLSKHGGVWAVIYDESSVFKNPNSKNFLHCKSISDGFDPVMRLCLNATPIENSVRDLFCQASIVEPSLFPSPEAFENRYINRMRIESKGRVFMKDSGSKNIHELRELISGIYIRREYTDIKEEIPDVIVITRDIMLDEVQRKLYNEIVKNEECDGLIKAGQLTRAALYYREDDEIKSPKFDAIEEIINETDQKIVIMSESKTFTNALYKRLKNVDINVAIITGGTSQEARGQVVNSFTKGNVRVLIGTSAIERGLNLQAAGVLINADLPWNPAKVLQRIGRIRRLKSNNEHVIIYNLMSIGTIEDRIVTTIYHKDKIFHEVFDADSPKFDIKSPPKSILNFKATKE